jgi:O-antigen/teichoic acid export membrane protein
LKSKLKILATDTAIYGSFTILQRFLTFFLTPFYTNYLLQDDLGNVYYVYTILAFFNVLYSFGMENAFFRFFKENSPKEVFSTIFIFVVTLGALISTLFYFISDYIYSGSESISLMLKYSAFVLFFDVVTLIPFALLRMERKSKQFASLKLLMVLIAVGLNIILIVGFKINGEAVFLAQAIASFIGILLIIHIIKKYLVFKINKDLLKQLLLFGIPTVPAALATLLLKTGDHFILPNLKSPEILAIYSTNYKLALPMMMFVTTFDYAFKPLYMNMYKDEDAKEFFSKVLTYFVLLCSAIFLIISIFMPYIVTLPFFGGKFINPIYWEGLKIIPLILGGYFFLGLFNYFALGINITKNTKELPLAVGIAMLVNLVGNFILIPIYSYLASAWLTVLAYLISAFILYFKSQKYYKLNYNWIKITSIILITIAIYFIFSYIQYGFFVDLLSMVLWLVLLFATKVITKNDINNLLNIAKKLKRK